MRFINPQEVELAASADWKRRALDVSERLVASHDDDRDAVMLEAERLWREVKPVLASASASKCWYCETKQSRAENDVDHFRPCLLYTSPSPRDATLSRMPSSA